MNELIYEEMGLLGAKIMGFCVGSYIIYRLIIKKKLKKKSDSDN